MKIKPKEFKIKLSIEDGRFSVYLEEGTEARAIISEPMTGDWSKDQRAYNNLRDVVTDVLMERFYPDLCPACKPVQSSMGSASVIDEKENRRRTKRHAKRFGQKA